MDATFCVYDGVVEFEDCDDESEVGDSVGGLSDNARAWMIVWIVFMVLFVTSQ